MANRVTRPPAEPGEEPARFRPQRLARWAGILIVGTLMMLACWQDPLYP